MYIKRLVISDFRNFDYLDFEPCEGFNFICGANGSGKTSIIEAIHYLSLARSFRTNAYQYLIKQGKPSFSLFALVRDEAYGFDTTIGLSRERGQNPLVKINAEPINRLVDLVDHICVQILHPQGVDAMMKESDIRRSFIDWGVYYSDSEFKSLWLQYRKVLKQRNALLRKAYISKKQNQVARTNNFLQSYDYLQKGDGYRLSQQNDVQESIVPRGNRALLDFDEILVWDGVLADLSEQINSKREQYLFLFKDIVSEILQEFLPGFKIKFEISSGWEKGRNLKALLAQNLEKDKGLGYTFYGCHRADLKIKNQNLAAGATLSRGQLKMLVYAMRLAQGILLKEQKQQSCIYLIDDLNSELDSNSQNILLNNLLSCRNQVFISNIQQDILFDHNRSDYQIFTLDRGTLSNKLS